MRAGRAAWMLAALLGCGGPSGVCPPAGYCGPPPDGLSYALAIQPGALPYPRSSSPLLSAPRQEIVGVPVDASWMASRSLRPAFKLTGTVRQTTATGGTQVASGAFSVVASRSSRIAGLPPVTIATETAESAAEQFQLALPREDSYVLSAFPLGSTVATAVPTLDATLVGAQPATQDQPISLPATSPRIGQVTDGFSTGIDGVTVRAIDPTTGVTLSTVTTSAPGPAGKPGSFSLLTARSGPLRVVVQLPSSPVVFYRDFVGPDQPLVVPLPCFAPAPPAPVACPTADGAFELVVVAVGEQPVAGARVHVSLDRTEPGSSTHLVYSTSGVTNERGQAAVTLIPGTSNNLSYNVDIFPPDSSSFSRIHSTVSVGSPGSLNVGVHLGLRGQVSGRILDAAGTPLPGALVSTSVSDGTIVSDPIGLPLPQATTDDGGSFSLALSPGSYDLEVVPRFASRMARWTFLAGAAIAEGEPQRVVADLHMPRTATAFITLLDDDGATPERGAGVLVYDAAAPACSKLPCPAPPLRASGVTSAQGVVELLLPVP